VLLLVVVVVVGGVDATVLAAAQLRHRTTDSRRRASSAGEARVTSMIRARRFRVAAAARMACTHGHLQYAVVVSTLSKVSIGVLATHYLRHWLSALLALLQYL
jgi:hypothetical protein